MTIHALANSDKNIFVIVGAGGTLKEHGQAVLKFIKNNNASTIGINNMTELLIPKYHLWTNSGRYRTYGQNIHKESTLLFGCNISKQLIREQHKDKFVRVNYTDKPGIQIAHKKDNIEGYFRTAGCLAVMIANLLGAKDIYIAGMDGYTYSKDQHLYGSGQTDGTTWEECIKKDKLVNDVLHNLRKVVKFSIITPTKFTDFYDDSRLHV